ncbi:unnamed protein product [Ectocarpus fasciculatus]
MQASGVKVWPHEERGEICIKSPEKCLSLVMDSLARELPHSIKLVDMVDAAVMRNVAAPAQLDVLAHLGGVTRGETSIIPVRENMCVLVLAPTCSEHALKITAGNVRRAVQQWTENHVRVPLDPKAAKDPILRLRGSQISQRRGEDCTDFESPFVADLSREVSVFCFDLWLDGLCLRGRVRDGTSKVAPSNVTSRRSTRNFYQMPRSSHFDWQNTRTTAAVAAAAGSVTPYASGVLLVIVVETAAVGSHGWQRATWEGLMRSKGKRVPMSNVDLGKGAPDSDTLTIRLE